MRPACVAEQIAYVRATPIEIFRMGTMRVLQRVARHKRVGHTAKSGSVYVVRRQNSVTLGGPSRSHSREFRPVILCGADFDCAPDRLGIGGGTPRRVAEHARDDRVRDAGCARCPRSSCRMRSPLSRSGAGPPRGCRSPGLAALQYESTFHRIRPVIGLKRADWLACSHAAACTL